MIDIDPNIEKEISLIQEQKLNSKIKEDIKRVVKVKEKPEDKLADFFVYNKQREKTSKRKSCQIRKKDCRFRRIIFFS